MALIRIVKNQHSKQLWFDFVVFALTLTVETVNSSFSWTKIYVFNLSKFMAVQQFTALKP